MKRFLSLLLTVALVFGISSGAFAASGSITGIAKALDAHFTVPYEVNPGDVWQIPLTADMFTWSSGTGSANEAVTTAQLRAASITVKYTTNSNDSKYIKNVSIANSSGKAVVKVEFLETYTEASSKDFRVNLFLAVKNTRNETSRITVDATFGNKEITCDGNDDYVRLGKGLILKPTAYNRGLELDLGDGVIINTRVYANQSYYGYAEDIITVDDDKVVGKFNSIDHVLHLTTLNLKSTGNIVSLDYDDYYAYDTNGNYLGKTSSMLPYSDRYFLSTEQINISGTDTSVGSGNDTGSSSSSSSSSTSSSSTPTTSTTPAGSAISVDTARTQMTTAVNTAKSSGSDTASVRFTSGSSISGEALRAMASTASASGLKSKMIADTMNGNAVAGRLTMNPALATNISGDIQLGAHVSSNYVQSTKDKFSKWYKNNVAVVSLSQKGSYGMSVIVAAKVDLTGLNTGNLRFYSYDKAANKYAEITNPNYSVDTNGYLHFTTSLGDDIVISDGALSLK